jgi:hypothetical protein
MKHEKFNVFTLSKGQFTDGSLNSMLNGKFALKSISTVPLPKEENFLVSIGYTDDKVEHEYQIVQFDLGHYCTTNHEIARKLKDAAEHLQGVICQDITIVNFQIVATFLTTK